MSQYTQGKNWTASGGVYTNGAGDRISAPSSYFSTVANNSYGYNSSYANGHGQTINNPSAYYKAVARCALRRLPCVAGPV